MTGTNKNVHTNFSEL